jgi:aminoglycoside phosphotransferase (APT) family kinase protein
MADANFVIERRIGGTSLAQRLERGGVATDAQMLHRTLAAIDQLADLLPAVPKAGELLAGAPVREDDWRRFLMARAEQELQKGRSALTAAGCDVAAAWDRFAVTLAAVDPNARRIVHGDLHPGNVMVDAEDRIVGIIDFGSMTLAGDPTLDRIWAQLNWPGNAARLLSSKSLLAAEQAYLFYWAFRFSNVGSQSLRLLGRSVAIIATLT